MPPLIDLVGKRFGRLTVIRKSISRNNFLYWVALCDCGQTVEVLGQSLRRGETKSCGCLQREIFGKFSSARWTTHGESAIDKRTPEYRSWMAMLSRCENPNATGYKNYGGRGIIVCERWHKYEYFLSDMGRRPSPQHSIDRINNDGNYELNNCRWATPKEQRANQRNLPDVHKNHSA